ncbi:MAG: hypothetical protein OXE76_03930 [Alphaproteobacteria bacterium]|nr:hypothetical protein [Alphaproteobacteria bacterium]
MSGTDERPAATTEAEAAAEAEASLPPFIVVKCVMGDAIYTDTAVGENPGQTHISGSWIERVNAYMGLGYRLHSLDMNNGEAALVREIQL